MNCSRQLENSGNMNEFNNIEKFHNNRWFPTDKEYTRFLRHLFCRLMDAYDKFPNDLKTLGYVDEAFIEFLNADSDKSFKFMKGTDFYRIEVCDTAYDYNDQHEHIIRFPKVLLDDDWESTTGTYLTNKRRSDLKREIDKLKEFIKTAPNELEKLERELSELNKD